MENETPQTEDEPPPHVPKRKMQEVKSFYDGLHVYMPAWGSYDTKKAATAEAIRLTNGRYRAKASRYGDKWYIYMSLDGRGGPT